MLTTLGSCAANWQWHQKGGVPSSTSTCKLEFNFSASTSAFAPSTPMLLPAQGKDVVDGIDYLANFFLVLVLAIDFVFEVLLQG
jgi:hypothetical protein